LLPYLANTSGWLLTEIGRYPWVVYGLVRLEQGVSTVVSAGMVIFSLVGYILIYSLLIVATIYLLHKYARQGTTALMPNPPAGTGDEMPSLVGAQD
jgi:cytochrome d ubiquinol oxidase subunit I